MLKKILELAIIKKVIDWWRNRNQQPPTQSA
jgi:hypothetical protein